MTVLQSVKNVAMMNMLRETLIQVTHGTKTLGKLTLAPMCLFSPISSCLFRNIADGCIRCCAGSFLGIQTFSEGFFQRFSVRPTFIV